MSDVENPLTVADVLDRAADLLTPEGTWTQGVGARDASGFSVAEGCSDEAVRWCIGGAINRITRARAGDTEAWSFLRRVIDASPPDWNDAPSRTQAEVVAKLREAAALAREQGQSSC